VIELSPRGVHFVFDAGPTARVYLPDVASRNVRALHNAFAGFIHVPGLVHAEVTAFWLQAVREERLTWDEYRRFVRAFELDLAQDVLRAWNDDGLVARVLAVQEKITELHLENRSAVPILHTHDAYYVALARTIAEDTGQRAILVTNDGRVWRGARALGVEVFHGNTCDLGIAKLHVGSPGVHFPEGADCQPCHVARCPSAFALDVTGLPTNLGSGDPMTQRTRASTAIEAAGTSAV
jgi:predicted nucleic acid-binding protein